MSPDTVILLVIANILAAAVVSMLIKAKRANKENPNYFDALREGFGYDKED